MRDKTKPIIETVTGIQNGMHRGYHTAIKMTPETTMFGIISFNPRNIIINVELSELLNNIKKSQIKGVKKMNKNRKPHVYQKDNFIYLTR